MCTRGHAGAGEDLRFGTLSFVGQDTELIWHAVPLAVPGGLSSAQLSSVSHSVSRMVVTLTQSTQEALLFRHVTKTAIGIHIHGCVSNA